MFDDKFDFAAIEPKLYGEWEKSGAFSCDRASGKDPFVVLMPPPNVTGTLHIGHALNNTLQDVLVRYHRMKGRDVLWQPGTDHAGIATQSVVERQLEGEGTSRTALGRDKFLERVWQWKEQSGDIITRQQRRLGLSPDWEKSRFTLDDGLARAVKKVFVTLYKDGLIYRAKRLVNWDPKLLTAVSDLEVKMVETKGTLYYIRYPLISDKSQYIVVATTRPETLFGDVAVSVHPTDERYQNLVGSQVQLPLTDRSIPIISDEMSDPEKGSGAVKITPAHDFNDFEAGRRHDLPFLSILDAHGCLTGDVPDAYQGMDRYGARKKIIADLDALGLLDKTEEITHSLPQGERSGVTLEPRLTDQWYVNAGELAAAPMDAVRRGDTILHPKNQEATFFHWMENIQPWCISRQLWWGHRIPAYYGPDGHVFVAENDDDANAAARAHYGADTPLIQDPDVLDTWFSSALWPFSTLGWPDKNDMVNAYYPSSILITGTDILFFWVARMMMMGHKIMGAAPFKDVYLHALVRDATGNKMSKSKGNSVDPLAMMDQYGADAIRFGLCALCSPGRDIKFSTETVETYRNFTTKLWNAARFCDKNGARIDESFDIGTAQLPVNRWIIHRLYELESAVGSALSLFRFDDAASLLYQFIWGTVCDWYVEMVKPILLDGAPTEKSETQKTAAFVLGTVCHLLHPFMPFVTETIWRHLGGEGLLIARPWPRSSGDSFQDPLSASYISGVIELVSTIRSIRSEMGIGPVVPLTLTVKDGDPIFLEKLSADTALMMRLGRLAGINFDGGAESGSGCAQLVLGTGTYLLPLTGVIDFGAEKSRLEKNAAELKKDIAQLEAKLSNAEFIGRAPVDIIEKNTTRLAECRLNLGRVSGALTQLG